MLPVAAPLIGKGTSILSGAIKKIFGGKDYISAKIGIFGGGGRRDLSAEPPHYLNWHYERVIKKLGYEGIVSPNESQRSAFWNMWESTHPSDKNEWAKTFYSEWESFYGTAKSSSPVSKKGFDMKWVWVGLAGLAGLAFVFLIVKRR